jgi:hypothetical protein
MDLSELRDLLDQLENQGAKQDLLDQTFEGRFVQMVEPASERLSLTAQPLAALPDSATLDQEQSGTIQRRSFRRAPNEAHWQHDRAGLNEPAQRRARTKPRSGHG